MSNCSGETVPRALLGRTTQALAQIIVKETEEKEKFKNLYLKSTSQSYNKTKEINSWKKEASRLQDSLQKEQEQSRELLEKTQAYNRKVTSEKSDLLLKNTNITKENAKLKEQLKQSEEKSKQFEEKSKQAEEKLKQLEEKTKKQCQTKTKSITKISGQQPRSKTLGGKTGKKIQQPVVAIVKKTHNKED
jgi:chromosome segregation ATPase